MNSRNTLYPPRRPVRRRRRSALGNAALLGGGVLGIIVFAVLWIAAAVASLALPALAVVVIGRLLGWW